MLLLRDIEGCFAPFFVHGQLFAYTDFGAPNFRIVTIALDDSDPTHWRDIVPQSDRRIQQFAVAGDRIFVTRVDRFSTQIEVFGIKDGERKDVPFSPHGTIDLLNPTNRADSLFYSYTSIAQPPAVYCYSTREEKSYLWQEANVPFDPSVIAVEEIRYPSKDGTSIPLFLVARRELSTFGTTANLSHWLRWIWELCHAALHCLCSLSDRAGTAVCGSCSPRRLRAR